MIPHIHENTLNVALAKAKPLMPGVESFCVHDFRRTARTHLAALGVDPHIAERCLNHKIKGDGLRAAQALAEKIQQGKLADGFTAREVRRNQWRYLTTDEAVNAALDWLEDEGWLQSIDSGGTGLRTGRRASRYHINPAVMGEAL